jgi:hypothetical protein
MATWVRILFGVFGVVVLVLVLDAAIRTFLLPRAARVRLSQYLARAVSYVFRMFSMPKRSYARRDQVLSLFPSVVLLTYQATWLALTLVAFAFEFIAAGVPSYRAAFKVSGSSIFTLGTTAGHGGWQIVLSYAEAGVGLTLLALLISFIPTLYAAFQRRETSVSRLTVRAGIPATPWGILEIAKSVSDFQLLDELWREWEQWFIDVGETHSTLVILNFYRSPTPDQTWIGSAASVLDAAALFQSTVDLDVSPTAGLCIRAGWINLRRVSDYFQVPYSREVSWKNKISISREEFDIVCDRLVRSGVPLVADRDLAWKDFVGWRVNYDTMIEAAYGLFNCPRVDWRDAAQQPLVEKSNQRGLHIDP